MKFILYTILALACSLSSCKMHSKIKNSDAMKSDYEIGVGESFQLELTSNPSTGYSWSWSNQQAVSVVEKTDSKYTANNPGSMGGGGSEVWTFKGLKSGSDSLKLEYKRAWEPDSPAESKTIKVTVK
jgi:inhibitor of cysteine peptidase